MQLRPTVTALSLVAALSAGAVGHDQRPDAKAVNPMAGFARLVGGEWRVTFQSGTSMFHTWHWGPGKHSIRRMTDGSGAAGEPWRALKVVYCHPGRKQVRLLGVEPFARGVADGTITFDGQAADAAVDLYQTGGRRRLSLRWAFDGPDKFRETLSEKTGQAVLTPLNELDHVRAQPPATPRSRAVAGASKPSERLKALEPLLGHAWETKGEWATGGAFHVQSNVEYVPLADAIYARVLAPGKGGETGHLLDAYLYHHTGANTLRCLALSDRGGVYEGDVTARVGGAIEIDFNGYEGDRVVPYIVRFDFEKDGDLRQRVWSGKHVERTLLLEVHYQKLKPMAD